MQAQNPQSSAETLRFLTEAYPELRATVAANPGAYPELLQWLYSTGDPEVQRVIAQRQMRNQQTTNGYYMAPPKPHKSKKKIGFLVGGIGAAVIAVVALVVTGVLPLAPREETFLGSPLTFDNRTDGNFSISDEGEVWATMSHFDSKKKKHFETLEKVKGGGGVKFVKVSMQNFIDENGKLWTITLGPHSRFQLLRIEPDEPGFNDVKFRDILGAYAVDTEGRLWVWHSGTDGVLLELSEEAKGVEVDYLAGRGFVDMDGSHWMIRENSAETQRVEAPEGQAIVWDRFGLADSIDGKPIAYCDKAVCRATAKDITPDVAVERLEGSYAFGRDGCIYFRELGAYADVLVEVSPIPDGGVPLKARKSIILDNNGRTWDLGPDVDIYDAYKSGEKIELTEVSVQGNAKIVDIAAGGHIAVDDQGRLYSRDYYGKLATKFERFSIEGEGDPRF